MKREGDTATETLVSIKELLPTYRKKKGVGLQDETTKSILDEYTAAKGARRTMVTDLQRGGADIVSPAIQ